MWKLKCWTSGFVIHIVYNHILWILGVSCMSFISSVTQLSDHNPIGQAAEQLPAEKLQEYRDIFLYFDRWQKLLTGDKTLLLKLLTGDKNIIIETFDWWQKHYHWNFWLVTKTLLLKLLTGDKNITFQTFLQWQKHYVHCL